MSGMIRRAAAVALFLVACKAREPESVEVEMRDGVHLATDIYLPRGRGPFPTILFRTPYSKVGDQWHAGALSENGIAVVAQDTRGRFESEGVDSVFTTDGDGELKDGVDTIAWIREQEWSNGIIGTSGESALGIVQYLAASADPAGLAVISPHFATANVYSDAMFQGGVRRLALSHNWLEEQGSLDFEQQLANHPLLDDYWESSETRDQWSQMNAAGYHVGGWYDIFAQGTLDAYMGMQHEGGAGAAGHQKLVMGPWTHNTIWSAEHGELVYPDNAALPPHANAWDVLFNHWLGVNHPDIPEVPDDLPDVQYYLMGDVDDPDAPGNEWVLAEDWPPEAAPARLHLQPDGALTEVCPGAEGGTTTYRFDPLDPSPTLGGQNLTIEAGPMDQREVEQRADVVLFETPTLEEPLKIVGRVQAHLFVEIDQPDADLMVRMTDVYPDGRSMLITDGALRLASRGQPDVLDVIDEGELVEGVVDLWSTAIVLAEGHRLRISVTSSNSPRFAVNQNNGLPYPQSMEGPGEPVVVTIHHSAGLASYLELPLPDRSPDAVVVCD